MPLTPSEIKELQKSHELELTFLLERKPIFGRQCDCENEFCQECLPDERKIRMQLPDDFPNFSAEQIFEEKLKHYKCLGFTTKVVRKYI
jgi:hypothetical protein